MTAWGTRVVILAVLIPGALIARAQAAGDLHGWADVLTWLIAGEIPVAIYAGITSRPKRE